MTPEACDCAAALRDAADTKLAEADRLHRHRNTRVNADNTRRTAMAYAQAAGWLNKRRREAGA